MSDLHAARQTLRDRLAYAVKGLTDTEQIALARQLATFIGMKTFGLAEAADAVEREWAAAK
jgi:hypothetical protein